MCTASRIIKQSYSCKEADDIAFYLSHERVVDEVNNCTIYRFADDSVMTIDYKNNVLRLED